ncbi:MAG: hypothetical protein QME74_03215, partial [Candidatus Edwardsbacteria bacterium]|nr:hypothetical protein [Candidatus Edwardsbacteria bacterium]
MAGELYRTYEVLIEESVHPDHPKRKQTSKTSLWGDGSTYAALCDTNAVFQDAVCYYTILLAGLAGNAKENGKPLNPLWGELCRRAALPDSDVAKILQRFAANHPKLSDVKSLAGFCEKLFTSVQEASGKMLTWKEDTYRIIEQQGTEQDDQGLPTKCKDMTQFASSWASILCDPTGETEIPGNGVFDRLHRDLHRELLGLPDQNPDAFLYRIQAEISSASKNLRSEFEQKFNVELADCDTEQKRTKKRAGKAREYGKFLRKYRKNAQSNLVTAFRKGLFGKAQKLGLSTVQYAEYITEYRELASKIEKITSPDRRFKRLRYGERDNSFEAVILRFLWLQDDPSKCKVAFDDLKQYLNDATKKPEQSPYLNGEEVKAMPYSAVCKKIFPLFVTPVAGVASKTRSAWWEFDASAFATAAEDVFKYKIRTIERERRVNKLRAVQNAFEGS